MPITINGTTGIAGVDGSASTPSLQGADTNTGMFFPAADTIAFAEGGVEAMRIDSSGNVGIGTTSPATKLHIVSGVGLDPLRLQSTVSGSERAWTIGPNVGADGVFAIRDTTATANRLNIDTSGNLQFNSGYGSAATAYGCRAWVNFNGTGTPAIRASGNVSSITDNGTGDYTVNFTTAMPDANYSIVGMTGPQAGVSLNVGMTLSTDIVVPTTSAARIQCRRRDTNSDVDVTYALVSVFR
jgi:hypothetical protein